MIQSITIEIVYSNLVGKQIFSKEDPDYRRIDPVRLTEDEEIRKTEDNNDRLLES
jgi:hypothetical protein